MTFIVCDKTFLLIFLVSFSFFVAFIGVLC